MIIIIIIDIHYQAQPIMREKHSSSRENKQQITHYISDSILSTPRARSLSWSRWSRQCCTRPRSRSYRPASPCRCHRRPRRHVHAGRRLRAHLGARRLQRLDDRRHHRAGPGRASRGGEARGFVRRRGRES